MPRLLASLCWNYSARALLGAALIVVPVLIVVSLAIWLETLKWPTAVALVLLVLLGLALAMVAGVINAALGVRGDITGPLPKNGYGLCSGHDPKRAKRSTAPLPLTDWLHELLQSLAGRKADDPPVTFGDLWGTSGDDRDRAERKIDLVLMTTNATRGVSHRFPFLEGQWGPLFANKAEFARLFPESVVKWMKAHAAPKARNIEADKSFFRLPAAADLPILVGARMSLSFPFLLSAVPLYAPFYQTGKKAELRKCWFSDGGLTSNFPIHFFDGPLPSRPTFGINLVPASVDVTEKAAPGGGLESGRSQAATKQDPWLNVRMPTTNSSGVQDVARFNEIEDGNVVDFFMMLFDTARNWGDTELMAMPGYRDRIVHVALAKDEGGMNLNMPPATIASIGDRGECAGTLLAVRFAPEPGVDPKTKKLVRLTWDNHRWVRYRSMMAALEDLIRRFQNRWEGSAQKGGPRTYAQLLTRGPSSKPQSYPFSNKAQREFAAKVTGEFVDFVKASFDNDRSFDLGESSKQGRSPRPKPKLRVMPLGSNDPREERPL